VILHTLCTLLHWHEPSWKAPRPRCELSFGGLTRDGYDECRKSSFFDVVSFVADIGTRLNLLVPLLAHDIPIARFVPLLFAFNGDMARTAHEISVSCF